MKKRSLVTLLIAGILISSLTGCGQKSTIDEKDDMKEPTTSISETTQKELSKKTLEKITLNEVAHSIFYAPMYVAIENGYFKEEGIDLDLVCGFGADKVMTAILSNEAQIGFMGSEASIYTANEGVEDPIVNFAQLTQRAGNFLVAREATDDFSWSDLIGTTVIGGRKGGMPEMVFEYILKQNDMNPKRDLEINQSIDFGSTAAAFSEGQGDYTIEFEPAATLLETEGKGTVVASLGTDSGFVPYTAFSAKKSYIDQHSDIIQAFTNALQKGLDYVGTHTPEEISKTISPQFPETDLETITTIVKRYDDQDTWKSDLVFEQESFDLLCDILRSGGELSKEPDYEQLVTTTYAQKAKNN